MIARLAVRLAAFSAASPRLVLALTFASSLAFAAQFPKVAIDTDPKHMLPDTSAVRVFNAQVEKTFALHADVLVLGIVNPSGIANEATLALVADLTRKLQGLEGVVSRDVTSLLTLDDLAVSEGTLIVRSPLDPLPRTGPELAAFRQALMSHPLFAGRVISTDGTATAIYVPLEPAANGKAIADEIRALLPAETAGERYYLAGDPVARDTFGSEMFRQMAVFSPVAGLVMAAALYGMFGSGLLVAANMAVAMVGIVWAMGLLIGLRIPVHIMTSMSPIFLMAIATDSVHIFNEFAFRFAETGNKRRAIEDTMRAVAGPVFYSDVTTAVGFMSLATASIVPVKVFGLVVGFGTLVILLMSYTLVPAMLALLPEARIPRTPSEAGRVGGALARLGAVAVRRAAALGAAGTLLLAGAVAGLFCIRVNNNMVHWFKPSNPVRQADAALNERLGGTSTAYLVVDGGKDDAMKDPAMLAAIEGLQRALERDSLVGKTLSVVDCVKRVNRVLHADDSAFDRIPGGAEEIGQYLFLFGTSARPSDLDNVVDTPFRRANVWVQLKSWDAVAMRTVLERLDSHLAAHPLPAGATVRPAGIAAFNLVWNDEVLWGMLESFFVGLLLVLVLLVIQTGSLLWGVVAFIPLLSTIVVIYGAVGLAGKDFDMPVAVLSTLSLGMAIDFSIHFVERLRQRLREQPDLPGALVWTVTRPGRGILLNALLFSLGFAVMVFADLTPYVTVGVLMAAIMLLSAVATLVCLPGLILVFRGRLLKGSTR